ncbi:MAG: PIN domain-containing protein [Verrucomicrobiota bacterium]
MAHREFLIDTGPLYALLDRRDQYHRWATEISSSLEAPLLTCDAVLSETFYLLNGDAVGRHLLGTLVDRGVLLLRFSSAPVISRVLELMETYREIPMSFADACLVCMVEQHPGAAIFTLDRDFTIYRQHRRRLIPRIAPF